MDGSRKRSALNSQRYPGNHQVDCIGGLSQELVQTPLIVAKSTRETIFGDYAGSNFIAYQHYIRCSRRQAFDQRIGFFIHIAFGKHDIREPQGAAIDEYRAAFQCSNCLTKFDRRFHGVPPIITLFTMLADPLGHFIIVSLRGRYEPMRTIQPFAQRKCVTAFARSGSSKNKTNSSQAQTSFQTPLGYGPLIAEPDDETGRYLIHPGAVNRLHALQSAGDNLHAGAR